MARLRFRKSRIVDVVTPIRLPLSSNRPPPLDPLDTSAVIWTYSAFSSTQSPDTSPLRDQHVVLNHEDGGSRKWTAVHVKPYAGTT